MRTLWSLSLVTYLSFVAHTSCHPILVVISFDGFRNDYINQSLTPNLFRLANDGVRGELPIGRNLLIVGLPVNGLPSADGDRFATYVLISCFAGHMISSFVTKTYPNHQSIATGYYEEVHGIVNNDMFDPLFNEKFNVDNSSDRWWTQSPVIPIWVRHTYL